MIGVEGDVYLFDSPRLGRLIVPVQSAQVEGPPPPVAETKPSTQHPWEGRFSTSTEIVHNSKSERLIKVNFRLEKRWQEDEFRFTPEYEFKQSNGATSTDVLNADAYFRHDFPYRLFALYAPQIEEDRNYKFEGIPLDYRLLRHELGVGVRVIEHDKSVLRLGVARNRYILTLLNYAVNAKSWSNSFFAEAELDLPYEIEIRNRGEYYRFEDTNEADGWKNEFEISKRLVGAVVLSLKHEYRRNAPEIKGEDYSKFVFLIGVDF